MKFDWLPFLTQWSKELLRSSSVGDYDIPAEVIASGWLGYAGATEEQIAAAEARLNITLPPSYREFLKVTNGWRGTGMCCVKKFWSIDEIGWHYTRNPYWVDMWIDGERRAGGPIPDDVYFVYGEAQTNIIRAEYFKATLEISENIDVTVYLLNPLVVTADGEWEAWFFANWLPGAMRYRPFWELMQGQYKFFQQQEGREANPNNDRT